MILGEQLVPQVVTDTLGLSPDQQWQKGDRKCRQRSDGTVRYFDSTHEWGGWKKWSSDEERRMELPALLEHWCALLASRREGLADLRRSGCVVTLDCCVVGVPESFVVEPDLLAKMADLSLTFGVTCYSHQEGDSEQTLPPAAQ